MKLKQNPIFESPSNKKKDPNPHDPYKDDEKEIPSLDMRKILLGVAAIALFFERAGII